MRTTIPWGDGTQDNIYLDYAAAAGDQAVAVSSDANGSAASRTKVVTFSAPGASPVSLTVSQDAPSLQPVFYERLKFDGQAYIDTGLVLPADCSLKVGIKDETLKAAQRYFGAYAASGSIAAGLRSNTTTTRRVFTVWYDSSSALSTSTTLNFTYTNFDFWMTPKAWGWGNVPHNYTKGGSHPASNLVLGNYTGGGGQSFTGEMTPFLIYGSDAQNVRESADFSSYTPVYTLRPCKLGNESGIWIVETNTFKGNSAGVGAVSVAGNIVTP